MITEYYKYHCEYSLELFYASNYKKVLTNIMIRKEELIMIDIQKLI